MNKRVNIAYGALYMYWWSIREELEPEEIDFDVVDNHSSITIFVKTARVIHNSTTILNTEPLQKVIKEVQSISDWVYDNYDNILTNEDEYLVDLEESAGESKFESERNNLI